MLNSHPNNLQGIPIKHTMSSSKKKKIVKDGYHQTQISSFFATTRYVHVRTKLAIKNESQGDIMPKRKQSKSIQSDDSDVEFVASYKYEVPKSHRKVKRKLLPDLEGIVILNLYFLKICSNFDLRGLHFSTSK